MILMDFRLLSSMDLVIGAERFLDVKSSNCMSQVVHLPKNMLPKLRYLTWLINRIKGLIIIYFSITKPLITED